MKQKTIRGHYGTVYSIAHNNRTFIPNNVDINRIPWNYNCVAAGQEQWLQKEMMMRYQWNREYKGSHPRGNLSTPDYQVARSRERLEALQQDFVRTLQDYEQQIIQETDKLAEAVDGMASRTTDFDLLLRYFNEYPENEYEELVARAAQHFEKPAMQKESRALDKLISAAENRKGKSHPSSIKKGSQR